MINKGVFLLTALGALSSHAVELNAQKVLRLPISTKGYTRLTIDGDKIQDVFARPVAIKEHFELHTSGHVLIIGEGLKDLVYLTVFSQKGHPQDLVLVPTNQEPSPIVLKDEQEPASDKGREHQLMETLRAFSQKNIPARYLIEEGVKAPRTLEGADLTLDKAYTDGMTRVLVYSCTNTQDSRVTLSPARLSRPSDLAIFWRQGTLEPQETTQIFILQERKHHETS